jgi:hypothetical protein
MRVAVAHTHRFAAGTRTDQRNSQGRATPPGLSNAAPRSIASAARRWRANDGSANRSDGGYAVR